jgi:hypothetical protein
MKSLIQDHHIIKNEVTMKFKVNQTIFLYIRAEEEENDGYFYATILKRGKRLVLSIEDMDPEEGESGTIDLTFSEEFQKRVEVVEGDELRQAIPDADIFLVLTPEEFETA